MSKSTSEITRITPEQVLEAYEATGITPIQNTWVVSTGFDRCACGLSVMYVKKTGRTIEQIIKIRNTAETFGLKLGLSESYESGFVEGFDEVEKWMDDPDQEYRTGYKDGSAAWNAVKEKYNL